MITSCTRTVLTACAAVGLMASAVTLSAHGQDPAHSEPAQDRRTQPAQHSSERDLLVLEAQLQQLREQRSQLVDELDRTRSVLRMLEEQLREARLRNVGGPELERFNLERENQRALFQKQEEQYKQVMEQLQTVELSHAELRDRIATEQAQREQAAREQDRAAAEKRRLEAEQQAATIYQDVLALAQQPDSTKALYQAMMQSEVQQLQAQYAGLQERLAQLEQLYQRGAVSQTELTEARTEADTLLAQIRQTMIRGLMQQVEREREGFAQRSDPLTAEVTGNVLQTEFFRGYLDTVQRYSELSREPADAAVAAVVTAADLLRAKGPQASIDYFEPILAELERGAGDPPARAAEAAVRMQLAEAYHAAERDDDALRVLRALIIRSAPNKAPQ